MAACGGCVGMSQHTTLTVRKTEPEFGFGFHTPGQLLQVVQRALHRGAQPAAARGVQELGRQQLVDGLLSAQALSRLGFNKWIIT